jgi:hypothetical protein
LHQKFGEQIEPRRHRSELKILARAVKAAADGPETV